ncbi:MAG: NADH-quinone oxidoreductase subunit I [Bacteroidetes bacterium CG02_land_8_20_14_3_00_31_25]|nr:4Fe-4S dicluster domain-containing protein [Bacteroidota bacterium]PIV58521.1 MAG: NADH-quinone oxidoreductase subunit I [Bacteroidetes bacterium CG02_land_8_20_14_3_00_31_25]PIX32595.1 MAG: NADH-quinone oxidoreductase subunit I [Bacteroidetes bacterium CG_4_8_14_3_um_filter_31_14]PIY02053.1 MAG: NADH-quinone oxidoreductase subunit I [Bacteroidetes bacterium CG_4_10_14_3_um_filter_31_20]
MNIFKYFGDIFGALKSLWGGMRVTGYYFFSPGKIVTQKYPENRKKLEMFERFKGEVIMTHDSNNKHACTGCGICEINCPNGSIEIISNKITNAEGKLERIIDKHIYHLSMCTFCGLCIKTCPSKAIVWGQEFEHAVFDRQKLTKVLNHPGSSLKKETKKEIKEA